MKDTTATVVKALKQAQQKQAELLAKIERATARLEKRKRRLAVVETTLAELERQVAQPRNGVRADAGTRTPAQLIYNPGAGRDPQRNEQRLAHVVRALRDHGLEPQIGLKTSGKIARSLAKEAARAGLPVVVVAAGDGTIGDVASQLVGTSVALGIVPLGTFNNLARSLGVPLDIDGACALIGMGTTRHIDVGRMHASSSLHEEYFLECAGVGLAAIGAMAGQAVEKHRWNLLPRALQRFFRTRPGTMQIELDGRQIAAETNIVMASNSPLVGSNLLAAPGAKMDDGLLDVTVYDRMGEKELMAHFIAASNHKPHDIEVHRARRVRIVTNAAMLAHSDMDVAPERNVIEIEVMPAALSMIVGNGIALTMPVESAPAAAPFAPAAPIEAGGNDVLPNVAHA